MSGEISQAIAMQRKIILDNNENTLFAWLKNKPNKTEQELKVMEEIDYNESQTKSRIIKLVLGCVMPVVLLLILMEGIWFIENKIVGNDIIDYQYCGTLQENKELKYNCDYSLNIEDYGYNKNDYKKWDQFYVYANLDTKDVYYIYPTDYIDDIKTKGWIALILLEVIGSYFFISMGVHAMLGKRKETTPWETKLVEFVNQYFDNNEKHDLYDPTFSANFNRLFNGGSNVKFTYKEFDELFRNYDFNYKKYKRKRTTKLVIILVIIIGGSFLFAFIKEGGIQDLQRKAEKKEREEKIEQMKEYSKEQREKASDLNYSLDDVLNHVESDIYPDDNKIYYMYYEYDTSKSESLKEYNNAVLFLFYGEQSNEAYMQIYQCEDDTLEVFDKVISSGVSTVDKDVIINNANGEIEK